MRDPENIREIAGTNPDFLGYIFYKGSPRYIGAEPDQSLFTIVPHGIIKTGVFVDDNENRILGLALRLGLDMIQLHGNESPDNCLYLRSTGLKVTKVFNITDSFDFEIVKPFRQVCDYFLFDTKTAQKGGSGIKFNWSILNRYNIDKPFFLSGGIGPDDANNIRAIENRGLFGVDVNSRFETAQGIKDLSLVKTFIDTIKKIGYEI